MQNSKCNQSGHIIVVWVVILGLLMMLGVIILAPGGEGSKILSRQDAILTNRGILGEHELYDLSTYRDMNLKGSFRGDIFFISGALEGKPANSLIVEWKINNGTGYKRSEIPETKIIYNFQEDVTTPTIYFDLDAWKTLYGGKIPSTSTLDSPNPEDYLQWDRIPFVRITISRESYNKSRQYQTIAGGFNGS